jgi:CheY-like chemotaxis protein
MQPTSQPRQANDETKRISSSCKPRVLVVDDNEDLATTLSLALTMMGNEVRTAYDGLKAIDVADKFRPDLVLPDIGLPKLNGFDAARRIREQPWGKEVFLVAATGWDRDEDKQRSAEAGFDLHMVKPVRSEALTDLLAGFHKVPPNQYSGP